MLFPDLDEESVFVHRADPSELLGSFSDHPFELDGHRWPTVEHYFQAMKFDGVDADYVGKIQQAATPKQARKLGRRRFKKIRSDWSKVKRTVMTRALYIKCKTHDDVASYLLETGERKLMEASQYDYHWGCGRDRRGENVYGKVLMDVRRKLREEAT